MSASPAPHPTANESLIDHSRVKWAWSMDRQQPLAAGGGGGLPSNLRTGSGSPVPNSFMKELEASAVKGDLLDVVRLISTSTVEIQTAEPSYTQSLTNVRMEQGDKARSIAVQAGHRYGKTNSEMQVVEADIAADGEQSRDVFGGDNREEDPLLTIAPVSSMHSQYLPNCNVPADLYPVFMSDARALGVSNRYGYVALPKPAVELPARRRVKAIAPVDYPHLYGSHNPTLDEHTGRQLHRAHGLWTSQCGFVPKY